MSLYNLDRFRFERKGKGAEQESLSPPAEAPAAAAAAGDEDEAADVNSRPDTPASDVTGTAEYSTVPETPEAQRTTQESYFKHQRGVHFLNLSDSEDEEPRNISAAGETQAVRRQAAVISEQTDDDEKPEEELPQLPLVNGGNQQPTVKETVEEDIRDSKLQTMKELFPQRSDQELLKLIESACTMDEAIAAGLKLKDKAASGKRKLRDSPTNCKTKNERVTKKSKASYLDDSEPKRQWERQEVLVKKLQKIFPGLDKEELREVLQEHNWVFNDALEALKIFADDEEGKEIYNPFYSKTKQTCDTNIFECPAVTVLTPPCLETRTYT